MSETVQAPVSGPHLAVWILTFCFASVEAVMFSDPWRWMFLAFALLTAPAIVVDIARRARRRCTDA